MRAVDVLDQKRRGCELSDDEIAFLIEGLGSGAVPDYQIAAFLMAACLRGMTEAETFALTRAMLQSGVVLDFSDLPGEAVDKHSTGGVGDKTSIAVGPLAASCGVLVPMITGRGLGHTGGTLDKLESIPGFDVALSERRFREVVAAHGCAMIGQTERIAPADRKLYALRDVTATVESLPLITASILSKKLAEGISGLVLDVKAGSGAFMTTEEDARSLAQLLLGTAGRMGKTGVALITNMDQPLGRAVGNSIEVAEAVRVLKGDAPADLSELCVELTAQMLVLGGVASDPRDARARARASIGSGAGLEKLAVVVAAQGGDPRILDDATKLPRASEERVVTSDRAGYVVAIDTRAVGRVAMLLGAGRERVDDEIDHAAGIVVEAKLGAELAAGDPLARLLYNDAARVDEAEQRLRAAYRVEARPASPAPLVHATLTPERRG